jgi:protein-S-isoprenylcysteine O-methyltransferase Ste14
VKLLVPPPIVALVCALAMWGIAAALPALAWTFPLQVPLAAGVAAIGLALDLVAVFAFRRAKTTVTPLAPQKASSLVVGGLYRYTRNPMYLGMALILTGLAIWLGSPVNLAVLAAFVAYITRFQIRPEEALLEERFGEAFREYAARVRRWL